MNNAKGLLFFIALLTTFTSNASPNIPTKKEAAVYNPEALALIDRAESDKTLGIPQRCWTLGHSQHCNMWFGVNFIFNNKNKLTGIHYSSTTFLQERKHEFGELSYEDFSSNGKPLENEILAIWRKMLSGKPKFQSSSAIVWSDPAPRISSIVFTASPPKKGFYPDQNARFELGSIEVSFK